MCCFYSFDVLFHRNSSLPLSQLITKNAEKMSEFHSKPQSKLLIVEDEVLFARAVMRRLQKAGYECEHVESLQDARAITKQFLPDIVLLDMRLPDGNGLDLLAEFVAKNAAVIVMTAHGEISDTVNAIKQGAVDYLKKPIDLEELLLSVQKAEAVAEQSNSLNYSRQRNAHAIDGVEMLGESSAMQSVKAQIKRISQLVASDTVAPTVLISGETGTGKDVAARLLHASCQTNNHYNDKPFVHIDCASLPTDLMESELFGHEKGAFTGALTTRPGLIEAAEDGTLFLDEIGELPLALQAKLLNVLERRVVRRLGSTKERTVPARFIAATNRDLHTMSQSGSFRQDLYYRLNVMSIAMPPLRSMLINCSASSSWSSTKSRRMTASCCAINGTPYSSMTYRRSLKRYQNSLCECHHSGVLPGAPATSRTSRGTRYPGSIDCNSECSARACPSSTSKWATPATRSSWCR